MQEGRISYDKITQLILYVIKSCEKEKTGITLMKLYKIFYFIDFGYWAIQDKSVTNLLYLRFKHGPVPMGVDQYLKIMEYEGLIDRKSAPTEKGDINIYVALADGELTPSLFPPAETDVINTTLSSLKDQYAKTASIKTHYHSSWINTGKGEIIPYDLAKKCDFEWLGYYSQGKSKTEFKEIENTRRLFNTSDKLKSLMAQVQNQ